MTLPYDLTSRFQLAYSAGLKIPVREIQKVVCRYYGVPMRQLLDADRRVKVVRARHVAMFFARHLTPRSFPELAQQFKLEDHTSVMHAVRSITVKVDADAQYYADVFNLLDGLLRSNGVLPHG